MMMSADTGVLDAARREAAAITAELQAQEGQIRRNIDLEGRLQQQAQNRRGAGGGGYDDLGLSQSVSQSAAAARAGSNAQFQSRFGISEELAFQRRFDDTLKRSVQRFSMKSASTGNAGFSQARGNVMDVVQLAQGNFSLQNLHGAAEVGAAAFGGKLGAAFGNSANMLKALAGPAALATAYLLTMKEAYDVLGSGAPIKKALKDWETAVSRTGKIATHLSRETREEILGSYRQGISGEGDENERGESGNRRALESFTRQMALQGNAGLVSAIMTAMNVGSDIQGWEPIGASMTGVDEAFRMLRKTKSPVGSILGKIEARIAKIKERGEEQTLWFAQHPDEALRYHEGLRRERQFELMRYERQQRDWGEM